MSAEQRNRIRRRQAGALLLDSMIGLMVVVFVILSSVPAMLTGITGAEGARQNTVAYTIARQAIENTRAYQGPSLPNGTYSDLSVFGPMPQLTQLRDARAVMTISPHRGSVKQVLVTVYWRGGAKGERVAHRTVTALVTPEGVTQ